MPIALYFNFSNDFWKAYTQILGKITRSISLLSFSRNTQKLSFSDWRKYLDEIASTKKMESNAIKAKLVDCGKPGTAGATVSQLGKTKAWVFFFCTILAPSSFLLSVCGPEQRDESADGRVQVRRDPQAEVRLRRQRSGKGRQSGSQGRRIRQRIKNKQPG